MSTKEKLSRLLSFFNHSEENIKVEDRISIKKINGLMIKASDQSNDGLAVSLNADMMQLGYMMSENLFNTLKSLSSDDAKAVYESVIPILKNIKGADVKYKPMYPNFPQQVIDASLEELYTNAFIHYWTFGQWKPDYDALPRETCFEHTNYVVLDLIIPEQFDEIFRTILSSHDSISEGDKEIIQWFVESGRNLLVPDEIPFKENLCFLAAIYLEKGVDISDLMNTATDVLRVITHLSGGDISLATNTKFKSLPRSQRRMFASILERVVKEEDIYRHKNKWIKLFHSLHIGDHSKELYDVAKKIRNGEKIQTFNSRVEAAVSANNLDEIIRLLSQRPSEFARRIDHLVRKQDPHQGFVASLVNSITKSKVDVSDSEENKLKVINAFLAVADDVPTRVLVQLIGHLKIRAFDREKTIVFPKGNTQKATVVKKKIKRLEPNDLESLLTGIKTVLNARFKELDSLGNVWIDPELVNCPLPSQQRSASDSVFTIGRGTKLPLGDKNTLRFFIYWIGQDIDLSATLHDKNFKKIGHVSYTFLKSGKYKAHHSGDITSAPNGASEFIDITIDGAVKSGARYVAMNVLVFNGPTFGEHKKCYAGWMTREKPNSKEIYDPKTVDQKVDLTSNSRNCIPAIFDLVERKTIWTDLTTTRDFSLGGNNVESNRASIEEALEAIVEAKNKINLYELFHMHADARGTIVQNREDANMVFSLDGDVTPYHINEIHAEYIA